MNLDAIDDFNNIPFEEIGLNKQLINDIEVHTLDLNSTQNLESVLNSLYQILQNKKVALEIGPGNQLNSLLFGAKKINAEVIIGIDPNFNYKEFTQTNTDINNPPPILLFKGDGWGNQIINKFFGCNTNKKIAKYCQLIAPDTDSTERMIEATISKHADNCLIILDSGAVEHLNTTYLNPDDIRKKILNEKKIPPPHSHLAYIKHWLRDFKQTTISDQEYNRGVLEGLYPPTTYLRKGNMIIFEK